MRLSNIILSVISDDRFLTAVTIFGLIVGTIDGVHNVLLRMALIG